jgi:metal-dependent amidase/aminoacylase/carboxypeptidase family protein
VPMEHRLDSLHDEVDALAERAIALSSSLHADPELALQEVESARLLRRWLEVEGFAVTAPVAGLETAFVARWGHGRPCIAYLLEYDALPGLGHGCGHNLIAAGGITAATALR